MKSTIKIQTQIILCSLILFSSSCLFANTIGGNVSAVSTIAVANVVTNINMDAGAAQTDTKVCDITINNNHIDGFNVAVSSANSGELRHTTYYNSGKAGTFVAYTLDIQDGSGKGLE